jgi:hypothetical protein
MNKTELVVVRAQRPGDTRCGGCGHHVCPSICDSQATSLVVEISIVGQDHTLRCTTTTKFKAHSAQITILQLMNP